MENLEFWAFIGCGVWSVITATLFVYCLKDPDSIFIEDEGDRDE